MLSEAKAKSIIGLIVGGDAARAEWEIGKLSADEAVSLVAVFADLMGLDADQMSDRIEQFLRRKIN